MKSSKNDMSMNSSNQRFNDEDDESDWPNQECHCTSP